MFRGLHNIFEDMNDTIFVLRADARMGAACEGFAEAYAFTGPPAGAKSFVVLRLLRLFGQGHQHHAQPLPAVYFCAPPRMDANASTPVTSELNGCRMCCPKEQPTEPINPTALKSILDDADVQVSARHNHSQRGQEISFRVTWAIVIQSQQAIHLKDNSDIGVMDKLVELRPPYKFVPKDEYELRKAENPRLREADPELADLCNTGALSAEVFFHMTLWYATLDRSVCTFRSILPTPPKSLSYRQEADADAGTGPGLLREWMKERLEYCTEEEATQVPQIHAALKAKFGSDAGPSQRTQAGIGPRVSQCRKKSKGLNFDYYKVPA